MAHGDRDGELFAAQPSKTLLSVSLSLSLCLSVCTVEYCSLATLLLLLLLLPTNY